MKKLILSTLSVCFILAAMCFMGVDNKSIKSVVSENVEALSEEDGDGFKCIYQRDENDKFCRIYVGVRGKIKLLGVGVIKADSEGYVAFEGKVVCMADGNKSCTPVECWQLYETIF